MTSPPPSSPRGRILRVNRILGKGQAGVKALAQYLLNGAGRDLDRPLFEAQTTIADALGISVRMVRRHEDTLCHTDPPILFRETILPGKPYLEGGHPSRYGGRKLRFNTAVFREDRPDADGNSNRHRPDRTPPIDGTERASSTGRNTTDRPDTRGHGDSHPRFPTEIPNREGSPPPIREEEVERLHREVQDARTLAIMPDNPHKQRVARELKLRGLARVMESDGTVYLDCTLLQTPEVTADERTTP